jgi:TPR repeat protein
MQLLGTCRKELRYSSSALRFTVLTSTTNDGHFKTEVNMPNSAMHRVDQANSPRSQIRLDPSSPGYQATESAWSQTRPYADESNSISRGFGMGAGIGLGILACLTLVGATLSTLSRDSLAQACQTASECNALGARFSDETESGPNDPELAARLFQRACDLGSAAGCNNLGLAYKRAQGVPQDYSLAMTSFERACSGGFVEGCSNQGALYEHGLGVPINLGDAQRLYQQACRRGSALGCSNLGVLYAEGRGVTENDQTAARLFGDACSAGSAIGCSNLFELTPHHSALSTR